MKRRVSSRSSSPTFLNKIIEKLTPIALSILGKCIEKNPTATTDQQIASIANGVMAFWSTIMNGGHPDHGMNAAMTVAEELPGIASIANIASSKIRDPNKQLDSVVNSAADLLKRATISALQGASSETKKATGNYMEDFAKLYSHSVAKEVGSSSSTRKRGSGAISNPTFTVGWLTPQLSGGDLLGSVGLYIGSKISDWGFRKLGSLLFPPPAPSPLHSIDFSSVRHLVGDAPFPKMAEAATLRPQYRLSAKYSPYSRRRKVSNGRYRGGDDFFNNFFNTCPAGFDFDTSGFNIPGFNSTVFAEQSTNLASQDAPDLGFFGNLAYNHPNLTNAGLTFLYPLIRHIALPVLGLGIQKFHKWHQEKFPNSPLSWVGQKVGDAVTAIGEKLEEPEYKLGLQKLSTIADVVIPAAVQDHFVHLAQQKKYEHDVKERNKKQQYAIIKAAQQTAAEQSKINAANDNIDSENAKTIQDMNTAAEQAEQRNMNRFDTYNEQMEEWWRVNGPILEYNEEVDDLAKKIHDQLDAAEQNRQSPLGKVFRSLRALLNVGKAAAADVLVATGHPGAAYLVGAAGKVTDKVFDKYGVYEDVSAANKRFVNDRLDELQKKLDAKDASDPNYDPNLNRDEAIKQLRGYNEYAKSLAREDLSVAQEQANLLSGLSSGILDANIQGLESLGDLKKIWWDQTPGIVPSEKQIAFSMKQKTDPKPRMEAREWVPPRYDAEKHQNLLKKHLPDATPVVPEYIPEVQAPTESNPNMVRAAALLPQILAQQAPKVPKPDIPSYIASMPTAVNAGPSGASRPLNTIVVPAFKQNKMFSVLPLAGTTLRRFGQVRSPYSFPHPSSPPEEDEEAVKPRSKKRRPGTSIPSRL